MARVTGLEPATSGVTGRRSNQLSYTRVFWRGGELGGAPWAVNIGGIFFRLFLAGMSQRAVLEEEAGDVGSSGGRKDRLHDDQQRDRQQRPRRPPYPGP